MKKFIYILILTVSFSFLSQAQEIATNAIGVRIGSYNSFVGELSYQRGLSDSDRLEFNLGLKKSNKDVDSYKFTTLYQLVWYIDDRFYWYAGAGAGFGVWENDVNNEAFNGNFLFATGDIGLEYSFCDTPLILSLDYRPEMYFSDYKEKNRDNYRGNIGLGIKFRF